jgi:methylenetetrahydrofolate dehydrogenase (NAD+)
MSSGSVLTASCKTISAKRIADSLLAECADGLKELGRKPLLVGFLANNDDGAKVYADWTGKTARQK